LNFQAQLKALILSDKTTGKKDKNFALFGVTCIGILVYAYRDNPYIRFPMFLLIITILIMF